MLRFATLLALTALLSSKVQGDVLADSARASQIVRQLAFKCRKYRKHLSYAETRKKLIQDAKVIKGLEFWEK